MQAFPNAHNFSLHNAVFTSQKNYYQSGRSGIDILRESFAPEAAFDSVSRRYAPSCFPGTRSQYIEDIVNWGSAQSIFPVYRMTGPAGVGKSAIAQTCAEKLDARYQLGASFFFKVNACDDYSRFFTSISYQLSLKFPDYHELLDKKLKLDPDLVGKQLRSQFRGLVVEPLRELEQTKKRFGREVILIDGLDECKDKEAQKEIIEIIMDSAAAQTTPFCWALFSRPEPQIEAAFADHRAASLCIYTFLPISRGIDGEIELYLRSGLQNILRRRGITPSVPWPTDQDIHALVSAAQGLYIYAATVLRFVGRTNTQYDPQELLRMTLQGSAQGSACGLLRSPFEELDAFYTLILQRVPNELHSSVQLLLSYMTMLQFEGGLTPVHFLCNVLRFSEIRFKMLCGELVAIINPPFRFNLETASWKHPYPASHNSLWRSELSNRESWLPYCHKSFFDFITDPTRSGPFCVNTPAVHNKLFRRILEVQLDYSGQYSLNRDIGGLTFAGSSSNAENTYVWPYYSETLSAIRTAQVFEQSTAFLLDMFFPYDDLDPKLLRGLGDLDHRKFLLIFSLIYRENIYHNMQLFNFPCSVRILRGTVLCSMSRRDMPSFDAEKFRRGISRLEAAQVIQRYQPSSIALEVPPFRCDSDGNLLSGLYIKGRDQMSTFWYWILDSEMRYFRCFETTDLAEGEKIFREEKFELWDVERQRGR